MKVVLVAGAAGRIGTALVEDLLKQGYKVLAGDINAKRLIAIKKKTKIKKNRNICWGSYSEKKY